MQAKDLRIGNLVYDRGGKILRIDYWERPGMVAQNMVIEGITVHPMTEMAEYLKPIPLTEEWLLKFGFDDKDYKDGYIGIEFTSNMTLDFVLTKPLFMGEWQKSYQFEMREHRIVGVAYVHQLQNLFFVLISQELEIKQLENQN